MSVELLGLPLGLPSPSSQVRFDPRISRLKPHLRLLPRPFAARDLSLYRKEPPPPRFNLSRRGAPGWEDRWGAAGFTAALPHHHLARGAFMAGRKASENAFK